VSDPITGFIRFLLQPEPWREHAECRNPVRGLTPADFILDRGQSSRPAKEACAACTVQEECVDYAHRTGSVGIWGGEIQKGIAPSIISIQDARPKVIDDDLPEWPDDPPLMPGFAILRLPRAV
jgi:hypothetical protein